MSYASKKLEYERFIETSLNENSIENLMKDDDFITKNNDFKISLLELGNIDLINILSQYTNKEDEYSVIFTFFKNQFRFTEYASREVFKVFTRGRCLAYYDGGVDYANNRTVYQSGSIRKNIIILFGWLFGLDGYKSIAVRNRSSKLKELLSIETVFNGLS